MTTPSRAFRLARYAAAATVLVAGCGTSWHRVEEPLARQPEPRQVMQLWVRGEGLRYDHIQVIGDSLTARLRAPDDYCRYYECDRRFALAEIDSIRTWSVSAGKTAMNVGLAMLFLGLLTCIGDDYYC